MFEFKWNNFVHTQLVNIIRHAFQIEMVSDEKANSIEKINKNNTVKLTLLNHVMLLLKIKSFLEDF
jgi:hypothetical protein